MSLLAYWFLFEVAEVFRHLYYIKTRKKSPRKWLSLSLRVLVALCMVYVELRTHVQVPWYIIILAYFFSGIFIHDTGLAIGTGIIFKTHRAPWYTNKTGNFDKPQFEYGPYLWIGKLMLGVGIPCMYYFNELKEYYYTF